VNQKSLYLFVLVVLSSLLLLTTGWLIGLALGGVWSSLLAGLGGAIGAVIGGEIGHRKGFFEADRDRLVIGGPWMGYLFGGLIASGTGLHSLMLALSAVLGAGLGVLVAKYLLRFFVDDPPLSIK
jgi:hypothetical protein